MAATARRSLRSGPEGGAPTSLDAPGATMTRASSIRRTGHMAQPDEPVDAPSPARNASPRMPPPSAGPSHVTFTLETPEPPRPRKRQRTGEAPPVVVPDTECSFCEGNVDRNRDGHPEEMISCNRCGSSGHFSCLHMKSSRLVDAVKSYDWVCMECKLCEACGHDDDDLLFCDRCDRGWHGHCINPPLDKAPKGSWICPMCRRTVVDKASRNGHKLRLPHHVPAPRPSSQIRTSTKRFAKGASHSEGSGDDDGRPRNAVASSIGTAKRNSPRQRARAADLLSKRIKGKDRAVEAIVGVGDPAASVGPRIKLPNGFYGGTVVPGAGSLRVRLKVPQPDAPVVEEIDEALPYGGILLGDAADPGDREPKMDDRKRFDKARTVVGARLAARTAYDVPPIARPPPPAKLGSSLQLPGLVASQSLGDLSIGENGYLRARPPTLPPTPTPTLTDSVPGTPTALPDGQFSNVKRIRFGDYEIETWYQAPYPEEYSRVPDGRLWLCEFCLKYMKSEFQASRHRVKCKTRHPPGDEIYRDGNVSVFEVDGRKSKIYCQNLCLLAKMFLDHKTLYYDVDPFLFYVMTESDTDGAQFIGYFSKEKRSPTNNVSCIMTLPVRQRRGWGNLLVDFSYLLSRKEGRAGTPEKPLSDLGLVTYRNYWLLSIFRCILAMPEDKPVTIEEIGRRTSITHEEVYYILRDQHLIQEGISAPPTPIVSSSVSSPVLPTKQRRVNLPRRTGRPGDMDDDDEIVVPSVYAVRIDRNKLAEHVARFDAKGYLTLSPDKLKWTPFLVTRFAPPPPPGPDAPLVEAAAIETTKPPMAGTAAIVEVLSLPNGDGTVVVDDHGVEVSPSGHVEPTLAAEEDYSDAAQPVTPPAPAPTSSHRKRKSVNLAATPSPHKRARRGTEAAEVAEILLPGRHGASSSEDDAEGEDDDPALDSGVAF